jgi:hypothetical protein
LFLLLLRSPFCGKDYGFLALLHNGGMLKGKHLAPDLGIFQRLWSVAAFQPEQHRPEQDDADSSPGFIRLCFLVDTASQLIELCLALVQLGMEFTSVKFPVLPGR